jgi:hypothetical protein
VKTWDREISIHQINKVQGMEIEAKVEMKLKCHPATVSSPNGH